MSPTVLLSDRRPALPGGPLPWSERLLRLWLEGTDELVAVLDGTHRLLAVSATLARLAVRPPESLPGLGLVETGLFGDAAPRVLAALAGDGAATEGFEVTWATADGQERIYRLSLHVAAGVPAAEGLSLLCARDVTELQRAESRLRRREQDFRSLAENSPDVIIRYGLDLRAVYCNRDIEDRVAVTAQHIVGRTPLETSPPGLRGLEAYQRQLQHTLDTGERGHAELLVPHPNGELRVHAVVMAAEFDAQGAVCGAIAVGRDVTEQVRVRQALAQKEREFRTLAENAIDHIVRWDQDARVVYANPVMRHAFEDASGEGLGARPGEIDPVFEPIEQTVRRVLREGRPELREFRFERRGVQLVHEIRYVPELDEQGRVVSVLGIGRDITDKIEQLHRIEALVRTDSLTGLANRQALFERVPGLVAMAQRHGHTLGLMMLDVDHFKSVNDGLGHGAGDQLLCEIARRLAGCLRAGDLLARLGGDEFVVVVNALDDVRALGAVAGKLQQALGQPLTLGARELHLSASIGVAVFPNDGDALEPLLSCADQAMYHAKRSGRARTEYYRRELGEAIARRLLIESALREARHGDGLDLRLQPQVCMREGGRMLGAEALLRWRHPRLGEAMPDSFIGPAEETGLIVPIGRWVLQTAAAAAVRCNRGLAPAEAPLVIAVNVSTRQFVDDDLPATVRHVLTQTGCNPAWLALEITESALADDGAAVRGALAALRELGLRIALDDFGTGYSSLSYLSRFPVDCLKIDKSFVHAIGHGARGGELVKAFIAMAQALGLSLVAEGVETDEQARFLVEHGCSTGQGYRYGRPLTLADFEAMRAGPGAG